MYSIRWFFNHRTLNRLILFSALSVPLSEVCTHPQHPPDSTILTIDRIFGSGEFSGRSGGQGRWIEEGAAYTTTEPSAGAKGSRDIVRYSTESGERSILIQAGELIPKGETTPLPLEDYSWSADMKKLLLFTRSQRVWRQHTRGEYWVLDRTTSSLTPLGGGLPRASLMFAKFSPDGRRVGYVSGNNIYIEDCRSHAIVQLTHDGSRTLINGTFDWVYEEEFGLRDGFRWSPDGSTIAYWQLDASGVRDFLLINDTDSLYSYVTPVQYPKVGETLSACRVGVVPSAGGTTLWFAPEGDPRNNYIAWMEWAGNSSHVAFQYLNRRQNRNQLILADAATGSLRTLLADTDSAWVDVVDDVEFLEGGTKFLWVSEKSGYRNAYLYSVSGNLIHRAVMGSQDLIRIVRLDPQNEWLYYLSPGWSTSNGQYLARASVTRPGSIEELTPRTAAGVHNYSIAPNCKWAFHTYSTMENPPVTELVSLPDHRTVRVLSDNAKLRDALGRLRLGTVERFTVTPRLLAGYRILPPDFDPTKRYPVLVYVYGEPAGRTVQDQWGGSGYLWHQMLAQRGYIVVSVDNRGTPAPRGRDWRKSVYGKIGILASEDQASAMKEIRQWPYVDPARIGIWGWSGGGSMTLNMLFRYPDLYHVGISVAPVPDMRLYDAIYQERYMGLLADNPDGYRLGSPITYADSLRGKLLVVHGSGDDNVHYQGTERLVNALVAANKQFQLMAYPNRSHGIFEGKNTTRHLYTLMTEFLERNLPPGPR